MSAARITTLAVVVLAVCQQLAACSADGFSKQRPVSTEVHEDAIADFVLALDTLQAGLPYRVREQLLRTPQAHADRASGHLRTHASIEGMHFNLEVVVFPGRTAADTVYLYASGSDLPDCQHIGRLLEPRDRADAAFCRYDTDLDAYRLDAPSPQRFGFVAYRRDRDGRARNVTETIFPPDPVLHLPAGEHYGAHDEAGRRRGAWVDLSRLPEASVIRLYLELGDGGGVSRSHPRALPGGDPGASVYVVHFGFLVWDGRRFVLREKVPRALWPCLDSRRVSPSGDSCAGGDADPFILPSDPSR